MRRKLYRLAALAPLLLLPGCIAAAVAGVAVAAVKLPFQVAGAAVDGLTTSQEEADRNAGKKARKEREAEVKAQRKAEKAAREAEQDDDSAQR